MRRSEGVERRWIKDLYERRQDEEPRDPDRPDREEPGEPEREREVVLTGDER